MSLGNEGAVATRRGFGIRPAIKPVLCELAPPPRRAMSEEVVEAKVPVDKFVAAGLKLTIAKFLSSTRGSWPEGMADRICDMILRGELPRQSWRGIICQVDATMREGNSLSWSQRDPQRLCMALKQQVEAAASTSPHTW